jgi:hypothetical protein
MIEARRSALETLVRHQPTDNLRMERRRSIRRELAEKQLRTEQRLAAQADVRSIECQLDVATAEHAKITQPIQDALATLDAERLDAAADQQPLSPTWQARRDAEQKRLDAANLDLEKISADVRQRLKVANEKLCEAQSRELDYIKVLAPDALSRRDLANPELLIQAAIAGQAVQFAVKREAFAREWLAKIQSAIADKQREANERRRKFDAGTDPGTLGFQLRETEACHSAACVALAAAKRELAAATQAIVDE